MSAVVGYRKGDQYPVVLFQTAQYDPAYMRDQLLPSENGYTDVVRVSEFIASIRKPLEEQIEALTERLDAMTKAFAFLGHTADDKGITFARKLKAASDLAAGREAF